MTESNAELAEEIAALRALVRLGERDEGVRRLDAVLGRDALAPGLKSNCALALLELGRFDRAERLLREALGESPDDHRIWVNLGVALEKHGEPSRAIDAYREALVRKPGAPGALNNLGGTYKLQGRHPEAIECCLCATLSSPDNPRLGSNLLLGLQYDHHVRPDELAAAHRHWGRRHGAPSSVPVAHRNAPDPERRLRLGYLSQDFRQHPVGFLIGNIIASHDREQAEVHCYASNTNNDELTTELRRHADHWRDIAALSDEDAAACIRDDGIDVLIELGGHTADTRVRVLAHRPAPITGCYLGYPDTSGLECVDLRFTDARADPPGDSDKHCTETLVRIDGGFLCYRPPSRTPEVAPAGGQPVTFGSFNNSAKISAGCIELWSRVLDACPGSVLLLKSRSLGEGPTAERVRRAFERRGIDGERIRIRGSDVDMLTHLAAYNELDVALDPTPYAGTTTTCEALWMGVPVVTLAGDRHASRVGASILGALGLDTLIAHDEARYVAVASALARQPRERQDIGRGLRSRMRNSPLWDPFRVARQIEEGCRKRWRTWCADRASGTEPAVPAPARPRALAPVRPPLRILHALSASGAMVVNQCLGAMDGVIVLSEIHPRGPALAGRQQQDWLTHFSAPDQAWRWYGLSPHAGCMEGKRAGEEVGFDEVLIALSMSAVARGARLLVRDWSHLDFFGVPFTDTPGHTLATAAAVRGTARPIRAALIRHPAAQWASLQRLDAVRSGLTTEAFLAGCDAYARATDDVERFRYESFTHDPDAVLAALCDSLALAYDPAWRSGWQSNLKITDAAGAGSVKEIRPATADAHFEQARDELGGSALYESLCGRLGYDPAGLD